MEKDFQHQYGTLVKKGGKVGNFLKELESDSEFKDFLYSEYLETPATPEFAKYVISIYPDKDLRKGFYQIPREDLDRLEWEFIELSEKTVKDKKYLSIMLSETKTIKQFSKIEDVFNAFTEKELYKFTVDKLKEYAADQGKVIFRELNKIKFNPIKTILINIVVDDNENLNLVLQESLGYLKGIDLKERNNLYFEAKEYLNTYLLEALNESEIKDAGGLPSRQGEAERLSVETYAILHVYLAKFGGKAITEQNKEKLAISYGFESGTNLRNNYTKNKEDDKRLDISTTNKRSAKTRLQIYKDILPILEEDNKPAYEAAKKDFDNLQKEYDKYH